MTKTGFALAALVVGAVALAFFWPRSRQLDCAFSGWKTTFGIELDAQVKDLDVVKTKLGLSDSQVREFDNLRNDFALKYDAACQDVRAVPPLMTQEEYTCLRKNMDRALDDIRKFVQAAEAAKTVADASAQKDIVLAALSHLRAADSAGYRANCASALAVDPKNMAFHGTIPERSVEITNRGNNDFTFAIEDYPSGFEPKPTSGHVKRGESRRVSLFRTLLPVPPARPLTFHVRTNLNDDVIIEIAMDLANADVWSALGKQTMQRSASPTIADALAVVSSALPDPKAIGEADKYVLAATALFDQKRDTEARQALDMASRGDVGVDGQPSVLLLKGFLASRGKTLDAGSKYFAQIKQVQPPPPPPIYSVEAIRGAARANEVIKK